ncbi:hypothetical protein F4779DRAFT_11125 [Xylariaceae sp. FL0662B]|nr:hypothetical protein F4779DRAFT_11125 [Xylariaceae sp. FL0662B]
MMAEILGVAASAMTVIELSAKIASLCLKYSKGVRHAKDDIDRVNKEVINLKRVSEEVQSLLDGPQGARLKASQRLHDALEEGQYQLQRLHHELAPNELTPGKRRWWINRFELRALEWPLESKDVEKIVQDLARCMQTITMSLQVDQTATLLAIDQKIVLNQLPIAIDAAFDSHAEEHNPTCLQGTRVDLLREISQWVDNSRSEPILWLNGMAGTGKSTIARTLAHSITKDRRLGASFFFKRGEGDRSTASKFFTTITAQLVQREPAFAPLIKDVIDADPTIVGKALGEQFEKLILETLPNARPGTWNFDKIVFIVDALDECEEERDIKRIINLFAEAKRLQSPQLRILLTSRPELPIRLGFKSVKGSYHGLVLHDISKSVLKHDISAFLKHELSKTRDAYNNSVSEDRRLSQTWPEELEIQSLARMAIPLFIFAATICRFVADEAWFDPAEQLKKVLLSETKTRDSELDKLDTIYRPILDRLIAGKTDRAKRSLVEDFHKIVGSIVVLAEPLSASSLARLLKVRLEVVYGKLNLLHSVLNVPPERDLPIRIFHKSFSDFLLDPEKKGNPFWVDDRETHRQLAANCLRVMNESLRTDIREITCDCGSCNDTGRINDKLRPEVQYACQHWVYHMKRTGDRIYDGSQAHDFLKQFFLHWFEALLHIDDDCGTTRACVEELQTLCQVWYSYATVTVLFANVI